VAAVVRTAFEEYRKEDQTKGKEKVTEITTSSKPVLFKTFKSNGATEFTGLADPTEALIWVENTEKVFRISHVNEDDKSVYAAALFTKKALTWWNNIYNTLIGDEKDKMPWETFRARFLEQYCPRDLRRRLEKEFLGIKQGDMSVDEYETMFNQKAQFATKHVSTEEDKIEMFVDGLRFEIKDFVVNRDILSFAKAVEYARKREYDLSLRGVATPTPKRQRVEQTASNPTFQSSRFYSNRKIQSHGGSRARPQSQSYSIQVYRIYLKIMIVCMNYEINCETCKLYSVGCSSKLPTLW
ncbi:retrotransposon gag domain-containing protein, partial [Labilibacter sediminis]